MDHDISLLVPELWCRLAPKNATPATSSPPASSNASTDFEYHGETIMASRLGYRITHKFVSAFFGRIFDNPAKVLDDEILRPETQDFPAYVDGIRNICEAQRRVARQYLEDGSIEDACPPLKALLHILARGEYEGMNAHSPEFRQLFSREYVLKSQWYQARLKAKQKIDIALWQRHLAALNEFLGKPTYRAEAIRLGITHRKNVAQAEFIRTTSPAYLDLLSGTLGPIRASPRIKNCRERRGISVPPTLPRDRSNQLLVMRKAPSGIPTSSNPSGS